MNKIIIICLCLCLFLSGCFDPPEIKVKDYTCREGTLQKGKDHFGNEEYYCVGDIITKEFQKSEERKTIVLEIILRNCIIAEAIITNISNISDGCQFDENRVYFNKDVQRCNVTFYWKRAIWTSKDNHLCVDALEVRGEYCWGCKE